MNAAAKKWVKALRSGDFEQGFGSLRPDNAFCCFGVACEISNVGRWGGIGFFHDHTKGDDGSHSSSSHLTHDVMEWLGAKTNNGSLVLNGKKTSLDILNDTGRSFNQIADIIEANAGQLFFSENAR